MNILDIPGYAEAVYKERVVRDAAFLSITESIGRFEVVPMTLHLYLALRVMRHPLLGRDTPSPEELTAFLWLLSPGFKPRSIIAKALFAWKCRREFYPPAYLPLWNTRRARERHAKRCDAKALVAAKLLAQAREYVDETFQDIPPRHKSGGFDAEYLSDGAHFCASLGREYGWSQAETLGTPMKRIFQYANEMKLHHGSKVPLCNPSDKVKACHLRKLNAERRVRR